MMPRYRAEKHTVSTFNFAHKTPSAAILTPSKHVSVAKATHVIDEYGITRKSVAMLPRQSAMGPECCMIWFPVFRARLNENSLCGFTCTRILHLRCCVITFCALCTTPRNKTSVILNDRVVSKDSLMHTSFAKKTLRWDIWVTIFANVHKVQ